jgi:hypothetical protein
VSPKSPQTCKRAYIIRCKPLNLKAGLTRLELATSDVTGRGWRYPAIYFFNEIRALGRPPPRVTPLLYPPLYPHSVIGQDSSDLWN